jgi:hypothetical protein
MFALDKCNTGSVISFRANASSKISPRARRGIFHLYLFDLQVDTALLLLVRAD